MVDRNSKKKRKRNTRQTSATLRVLVNWVLDLMVYLIGFGFLSFRSPEGKDMIRS